MLAVVKYLFASVVKRGTLRVTDAGGAEHRFGDGTGHPVAIRLHTRSAYRRIVSNPALHLGEAYMDGSLTIEEGSLYDFLELILSNLRASRPAVVRWLEGIRGLFRRIHQYNPAARARRNVAHHYDLDRRFYDLFLDDDHQYSCAYFETEAASLDDAQLAKKRHIAAKLRLKPNLRILDIGSGWGGLGLYLAETSDVDVTGITLSEEQLQVSNERAAEAFPTDQVRFELKDYRDVEGRFDRIVSVGMFEHVGVGYYETFFKKVGDLLTDDGVALLHTIGRFDGPGATNPWLAKYIFPGGYSPALSEILPSIERSGLLVTDVEILRLHYARTLREWRNRFYAAWDTAAEIYDQRFCRMWEFYLVGAELSFRYQDMTVFQIQIAKDQNALPLTRDYMGEWENAQRRRDRSRHLGHRMAGE